MTNQLTYTDLDTDLLAPAGPTLPANPSVVAPQPDRPTGGGRRWMLLAGGAILTATAVLGVAIAVDDRSDTVEPATDQRSASAIIQDEIDAALAEMSTAAGGSTEPSASAIIQGEIDAALARQNSTAAVQQPAYLLVQNAIDAALAERDGVVADRPTAQLVQDEIDAALAAAAAADDDAQRPGYLIVQDEIDAALAQHDDATTD